MLKHSLIKVVIWKFKEKTMSEKKTLQIAIKIQYDIEEKPKTDKKEVSIKISTSFLIITQYTGEKFQIQKVSKKRLATVLLPIINAPSHEINFSECDERVYDYLDENLASRIGNLRSLS